MKNLDQIGGTKGGERIGDERSSDTTTTTTTMMAMLAGEFTVHFMIMGPALIASSRHLTRGESLASVHASRVAPALVLALTALGKVPQVADLLCDSLNVRQDPRGPEIASSQEGEGEKKGGVRQAAKTK